MRTPMSAYGAVFVLAGGGRGGFGRINPTTSFTHPPTWMKKITDPPTFMILFQPPPPPQIPDPHLKLLTSQLHFNKYKKWLFYAS